MPDFKRLSIDTHQWRYTSFISGNNTLQFSWEKSESSAKNFSPSPNPLAEVDVVEIIKDRTLLVPTTMFNGWNGLTKEVMSPLAHAKIQLVCTSTSLSTGRGGSLRLSGAGRGLERTVDTTAPPSRRSTMG